MRAIVEVIEPGGKYPACDHLYSEGMGDLEVRHLRYFTAVAEELNFTAAASRLGIAQPPLSRAIRGLEARLGTRLLERTTRQVRLTPAGEVLLSHARRALDAVAAAERRTRRAGATAPRLLVVTKAGGDAGLLPAILEAYAQEPDQIPAEVVFSGIGEQLAMLCDGRADVGLLHGPWDTDDPRAQMLDTETLRTEPLVAVLPIGHRLARRQQLSLAELSDEPLPRWPGQPASAAGPLVRDSAQLLEAVALGQTVALLPGWVRRHRRSDLAYVRVSDAPLTSLVVAWPELSTSRAVAAFIRAAVSVADEPDDRGSEGIRSLDVLFR